MRTSSVLRRRSLLSLLVVVPTVAVWLVPTLSAHSASAPPSSTTFSLFPNKPFKACLTGTGKPKAQATVVRGSLNDPLTLTLSNFKPNLAFDLFTVQRSNQKADGTPVSGFTNFGLAWYQSDIQVDSSGSAKVKIKTILLDQIFGFDPDVSLAPTNTFHVGFWFNNPTDAASCGFTGFTPFNGEHHAGPLAFITRPNALTGLGPLCTNPDPHNPEHCIP
jgi:hypothetical protein